MDNFSCVFSKEWEIFAMKMGEEVNVFLAAADDDASVAWHPSLLNLIDDGEATVQPLC